MNPTPSHMWEAKCEDCKEEMMPDESTLTYINDHIMKTRKLIRIETFLCPECGATIEKKYEENFGPYD